MMTQTLSRLSTKVTLRLTSFSPLTTLTLIGGNTGIWNLHELQKRSCALRKITDLSQSKNLNIRRGKLKIVATLCKLKPIRWETLIKVDFVSALHTCFPQSVFGCNLKILITEMIHYVSTFIWYLVNALHDGLPVGKTGQVLLPKRTSRWEFDIQLVQKNCCSVILSFFSCFISRTWVLTTHVTNLEIFYFRILTQFKNKS